MDEDTGRQWETYPHEADIGIRGYGSTLAECFANVGLALTSSLCDLSSVKPEYRVRLDCQAPDPETLLYEWVNTLVYEMATSRMLFSRFKVELNGNRLWAEAWGEPLDPARHEPAAEVKGATFTDLRVAEIAPGRWMAQCIVDV